MSRPFANLDGLVRLSHNEGVDVRRPLLRVLTDLYVQESSHTREEEHQYVELALRLLPDVDPTTRMVVARKLHSYPQAPAAVVDAILRATPDAAAFLGGAQSAATEHASGRIASFSPAASAEDTDGTARGTPAGNESPQGRPTIQGSDSPDSFGETFLQMTPRERAQLLHGLEHSQVADGGGPVALPLRLGARKRLERAALQRNRHEFARELELALGIPARVAWRVAQDDSGELIVVAAKALDMRLDMLVRVLLILSPSIGESVERVFTLTSLYEKLLPEAVMPIVAGWREEATARTAARFRSMHAEPEADGMARPRELGRTLRDDVGRRGRPAREGEPRLPRQDAS